MSATWQEVQNEMQVTYHYFVDSDITSTTFETSNPDFLPARLAWCCPVCGDTWARAVPAHSARWVFITAPCRKHRYYKEVPGSLLAREPSKKKHSPIFWARVVEHLPEVLLRRELELTLKYFEGLENESNTNSSNSPQAN